VWGENLATNWYRRNGWRIVARNARHGRGEIDIIAERRGVIAVCEVKTRASNVFGAPAEAMTDAKCRSVRLAALGWAHEHGIPSQSLRFDVAVVTGTKLDVIERAF